MIAECMILLASFSTPSVESPQYLDEYIHCASHIPNNMMEYIPYYVEHYDKDNLYTALRIGWCESRGKSNAYRKDNGDSGVMQFVSWTWNWVAEKHNMPIWDTEVLTYGGIPIDYLEDQDFYVTELFDFQKVQFVPYYNIMMSSLLAEDTYSKTRWKDWNSSKWCWEDAKSWEKKWRKEEF